jgi:hypothetical protein
LSSNSAKKPQANSTQTHDHAGVADRGAVISDMAVAAYANDFHCRLSWSHGFESKRQTAQPPLVVRLSALASERATASTPTTQLVAVLLAAGAVR